MFTSRHLSSSGVRTLGTATATWRTHWPAASRTGSQGESRAENTVSSSLRLESVRRLVAMVPSLAVRLPSWCRAATCRCCVLADSATWTVSSLSPGVLRLLASSRTISRHAVTCAFSRSSRPSTVERM